MATDRTFTAAQGSTKELRVVQFNVLADGLSGKRPDLGGFADIDASCLEWTDRSKRLLQEISSVEPHVICLEEVDHPEDFVAHFPGYGGTFIAKPNSPALEFGGAPDGCLILYDRARFQRVEPQPTESFSLGRNQVASCVVVRDLLCSHAVYVLCCAHFKASKSEEGEAIRVEQAKVVNSQLQTLSRKYGAVATILCTDLNGVPTGRAYQECVSGTFRSSMYELRGGSEPPMTTCKKRGTSTVEHTIDYIFYDSSVLKPTRALEIPEGLGCLPSVKYPSDHVMLCVGFETL